MITVTVSPELRKYLAARGLTLDALDEQPEPEEMFEPSEEDEAAYVAWSAELDNRERDLEAMYQESLYLDAVERASYEREFNSWTIRPV